MGVHSRRMTQRRLGGRRWARYDLSSAERSLNSFVHTTKSATPSRVQETIVMTREDDITEGRYTATAGTADADKALQ